MKEELSKRLLELKNQYEKIDVEKQSLLDRIELLNQKKQFLSGAYEELKFLIKSYYSEEKTPCEQPET